MEYVRGAVYVLGGINEDGEYRQDVWRLDLGNIFVQ
jgi:hypothetical protein